MENKSSKKWYQKVSNWLIIVACVILIPILLINLWIIYQAKTNEKEIPSVFGYKPFIVLSGSMETKIHKGDLIIAKIVEPASLEVNDIIAFRDQEDTVTTHRIIDVITNDGETYFITKGDANNTQDQNLVAFDDVEGIYVFRIPGIGSIMNSLSEPTTIIIVLMGITLICVIGFGISTKKQRELEKKEYLEYKKMKEEQAQAKAEETKKTAPKKSSSKKNTKSSSKKTK